jgi:hypothetical protein
MMVNDGMYSNTAMLSTQLCDQANAGAFVEGSLIRVTEIIINGASGKK